MSYAKERDEFIGRFCRAVGDGVRLPNGNYMRSHDLARLILRHAKTHGNLAEAECNGPGDYVNRIPYPEAGRIYDEHQKLIEKRQAHIERRLTELAGYAGLSIRFGGDPRGYTVKIAFPDGSYNTWGGREDGWGVPQ